MLIEAIFITVISIITILFFKEKPPTPPSSTSDRDDNFSYIEANKILFKNKNFVFIFIFFAFVFGIFNTISTVINYLILPFGFSNVSL